MRRFVSFGPAFVVLLTITVTLLAAPAAVQRMTFANTSARISLARQEIAQDDILQRIDRAVAAIAEAVEPSVVHIDVRNGFAGSTGSGWVYDNKGHIVTNAHVVRDAGRMQVQFYDGRIASAELVGSDALTDIAVIRADVSDDGLFPLDLAQGRAPKVGERVFAFGSPFGFKFSMSEGIISGLGRVPNPREGFGGFTNFIQHDAAVNPGNSGGPLIDTAGRVVGMNVAIVTGASPQGASPESTQVVGDSAGISFAIPVGTIRPIVEQLIAKGRVERGFLGVSLGQAPVRVDLGEDKMLVGVRIEGVNADSPAARAGLQPGDVVLSVAGYPTATFEALSSLISSRGPGQTVEVEIARDGETQVIQAILADIAPEAIAERASRRILATYGMVLRNAAEGAAIAFIQPGSAADESGLEQGQRVLEIGGVRVSDAAGAYARLVSEGFLEGAAVEVTVIGDGEDAQPETEEIRIRP